MNDAFDSAAIANGSIETWDIGTRGWDINNSTKLYLYFKPYLSIQKECGSYNENGCFAKSYKALSGQNAYSFSGHGYKVVRLKDGIVVGFWSGGINNGYGGINAIAIFDINGDKAPNIYGKDFFMFIIGNIIKIFV